MYRKTARVNWWGWFNVLQIQYSIASLQILLPAKRSRILESKLSSPVFNTAHVSLHFRRSRADSEHCESRPILWKKPSRITGRDGREGLRKLREDQPGLSRSICLVNKVERLRILSGSKLAGRYIDSPHLIQVEKNSLVLSFNKRGA